MKKIIELSNLDFSYNGVSVLEEINLEVFEGDFLAIIGPNGGGKTTLVKLMLGLLKPKKGIVKLFNQNPQKSRILAGYVSQTRSFNRTFPITVEGVVLMGCLNQKSFLPFYTQADYKKAENAMKTVGILEYRKRKYEKLSGGQQQKVRIARALAVTPQVLILDEPSSHIDNKTEKDLYVFLKKLNQEKNVTILLVSHDIGAVSQHANKIACVNTRLYLSEGEMYDEKKLSDLYQHEVKIINHKCKL